MGIEPTPSAWKAEVLPLNYTRLSALLTTPAALVYCSLKISITSTNETISTESISVNCTGGGGWIRTSVLRENGFTVRRL